MKDVIKIFSLPRYLDGRHVSVGCAASSSWGPKLGIYIWDCTLYFTHFFIINPFKWVLTYLQFCLNLWYPLKGCMPGPWAWLVVMLWCECVWHIAASHQSPVTWLLPNEAHISHLAPNNGLDPDLLSMVPSLNPHYTHLCHHLVYSSCLSSWGSKYK